MAELGYVEGQDFVLTDRYVDGRAEETRRWLLIWWRCPRTSS
ncbi:MAG: hypothetical protein U0893_08845 [Chloroflexota bacterium]